MAKVVFGLSVVITLAILAIATIGGPRSGGVEAHATDLREANRSAAMSEVRCAIREVALDEGYGITRKVMRRICQLAE